MTQALRMFNKLLNWGYVTLCFEEIVTIQSLFHPIKVSKLIISVYIERGTIQIGLKGCSSVASHLSVSKQGRAWHSLFWNQDGEMVQLVLLLV